MIYAQNITKYKYNLDSGDETTRQLATSGGKEIVSILVTAGAQPAVLRVHDSANGAGPSKDSILIAANAGESTPFTPSKPIVFERGLYIVMEQGTPSAEAFISWN